VTPQDGRPSFSGPLVPYQNFAVRFGWTPSQVEECPLYLGCLLLGAISDDDQENLELSVNDFNAYYGNQRRGRART
jgi:hypothetical protein